MVVCALAAGVALLASSATQAHMAMSLAVTPCTQQSNQALTCYKACSGPRNHLASYGMNQFLHSPGNCMAGNTTDYTMYATPCNLTDRDQRFMLSAVAGGALWMMDPEKNNKVTFCITANCTAVNSTNVECSQGAAIVLAPCQGNWPGAPVPNVPNPLQVWSLGATAGGPSGPYGDTGALKLAYTWHTADHPKGKPAKKNTTSCLTASGFPPTPTPPPTPPLPPAPPATAGDLAMSQCTNETDQDLTCYQGPCGGPRSPSYGMLEFKHHPGSCLNGNLDDKLMHTMPCNLSVHVQRFAQLGANAPGIGGYMLAMNPEHENKVTYCITANCTVVNATSVLCHQGARVGLAPCVFSWPGTTLPNVPDPRQVWTPGASAGGTSGPGTDNGAWKLAFTWDWSAHPKHKPAKKNTTSCLTMIH